ncbi:hypothetical protein MNBD_CHLOROFLEXI01-4057 [hydrothermal vent metagenome]|uniref:Uncharacterized protein n=1 Tax=hydrothermal vent metagenome TaxID=652676 RepID=A0A3B0VJ34_9ZZZZ
MNRKKYLLGALASLTVVAAGTFAFVNQSNNSEPEPIAAVTNSDSTEGLPEAEASPEVADLPVLPALEGNQAGGFGGGGDTAITQAESIAFDESAALEFDESSFIYTDPFSGTTFILNSPLPTEPLLASVLQSVPTETITVEEAEELATRFGFSGPLYREQYPFFDEAFEETFDVPDYEQPIIYRAFDGSRELTIDPWGVYYSDNIADASVINDYANLLPFEQAAPIAEAFLNERGLLDFEYEVQQIWGSDVNFVRKIDGQPVNQPEITVGVSQDGRIFFVSYQALRNGEILGRYPLISAEAAWEILQNGVVENNIPYSYSAGPEEIAFTEPTLPFEDPYADLFQFWMREYAPSDTVHLYEWPIVYLPVDGDAQPRIQIRNYVLQADDATLNAMIERVGQQIHAWGQVGPNGDTLAVAGWEVVDQNNNTVSGPGIISRQGELVLFNNEENGRTYIIPDAPVNLEDGLEVYLFAWAARDLGQEYLVLDWENIEKIIEYPEEFLEEPVIEEPEIVGEGDFYEPFAYELFTVNKVSLTYYTSYVWPDDEDGEFRYGGQPTVIIQPTWNFSGETDTGEFVEFFVQATEAQYLNR